LKKKIARALALFFLPPIGAFIIWLLYRLNKKEFYIDPNVSDKPTKTIRYFGFETIAGSTNRNAVKALMQAIKALKEGYDIGITPDGPKGPRHSVSDGIIVMAQKAKADILLVEIKPTKFWQFNSWDRFKVPKPFGVLQYYSKRINVCDMELEEAREIIKKGLLEHES